MLNQLSLFKYNIEDQRRQPVRKKYVTIFKRYVLKHIIIVG